MQWVGPKGRLTELHSHATSANQPKQDRYDRYNQKRVDEITSTETSKSEETKCPNDNQNNSYRV
jgi:hypothetical protein